MTDKTRIRIAAAVTALFIAGMSAAGLAMRDNAPQTAGAIATRPAATTPADATAPGTHITDQQRGDDRHEADDERFQELEDDE